MAALSSSQQGYGGGHIYSIGLLESAVGYTLTHVVGVKGVASGSGVQLV